MFGYFSSKQKCVRTFVLTKTLVFSLPMHAKKKSSTRLLKFLFYNSFRTPCCLFTDEFRGAIAIDSDVLCPGSCPNSRNRQKCGRRSINDNTIPLPWFALKLLKADFSSPTTCIILVYVFLPYILKFIERKKNIVMLMVAHKSLSLYGLRKIRRLHRPRLFIRRYYW